MSFIGAEALRAKQETLRTQRGIFKFPLCVLSVSPARSASALMKFTAIT